MQVVDYQVKVFRGENGAVNIDVEANGEAVRSIWIEGGDDYDLPPVELVERFRGPEVEFAEVRG